MYTLNVRSIANKKKCKNILDWLGEKKPGIFLLQETHSVESDKSWHKMWSGNIYLSHGSTKSCGVAILISKEIKHDVISIIQDKNGRFIILKLRIDNEVFVVINTYFPTKDKEKLQIKLLEEMENHSELYSDDTILWGAI